MALRIASKLRYVMPRAMRAFSTTANELVFRNATVKDVDVITRSTIQDGFTIGPYDFPCGLAFDPKSCFLGEVNGELAAHFSVVSYPKHHYHGGGLIVSQKFRQKGYGQKCVYNGFDKCDKNYTIGIDVSLDTRSKLKYEKLGFEKLWDAYVARLNLERTIANTARAAIPCGVAVKPIHNINLNNLLEYDQTVFGTPRQTFITRWINVPWSLGWAAVHEKSDTIVGYAVVKQVIRGGGTEIGLAMAPLYANDVHIAKLLLQSVAKNCLANEAVPKIELELYHPVGDNCGEGAAELMDELEADLTHIAYRMYTKGIPPGRQTKKIYGIASHSFD